ncbi:MAG: hypothetical protein COA78_26280 [Blastopirellula sp.]|nr:MAG: hypothetical protein COA78_26280 [Blastopirellula sp.]
MTRNTKQALVRIVSLSFLLVCTAVVVAEKPKKRSTQRVIAATKLFDGKSFAGWEGNMDWFRIEDKAVVAGSLEKKIPNNEFLCTKKTYADFELRLEAKLSSEGKNAGIQFRSKRIPNHHEVIGFQCDMGGTSDRLIWGALYDESRRRTFLAQGDQDKLAKVYKENDWNQIRIRAQGPRIQIWINGLQTVDYTEKEADIATSGVIALQIHSGAPAEASYRNIMLTEL